MQRLILILLLLPTISFAECTQETIQYYLDKGFNQEQITKLCTTTAPEAESYQPYQKPVIIVQEGGQDATGLNADERKAINVLRGGIDGRSIEVTPENVNFIKSVCIELKQGPEIEKWVTKCVDVAYSVSRDNLIVIESGLSLFVLGHQKLEIASAAIKRKHVTSDPWKNFPPEKRGLLERKYEALEKGNTTTIPLRKTADPGQVVNAIRTLADATKAKQDGGTTTSEVARVLDDSYVPPTEEEYTASQPTYEEAQEEKKKKKKWWNPFD